MVLVIPFCHPELRTLECCRSTTHTIWLFSHVALLSLVSNRHLLHLLGCFIDRRMLFAKILRTLATAVPVHDLRVNKVQVLSVSAMHNSLLTSLNHYVLRDRMFEPGKRLCTCRGGKNPAICQGCQVKQQRTNLACRAGLKPM